MVEQQQQIKRDIAIKTRIKHILEGKYVKEEGWKPNFITTIYGENIARVNIIGIVVSEPNIEGKSQTITIDDGSDKITLRSFEDGVTLSKFVLGDVINVIGKPKEYVGLKYVVPELIKKINNNKWLEIRKKELELKEKTQQIQPASQEPQKEQPNIEESVVEEKTDVDNVIDLIKKLDSGDGVFVEDLLSKLNSPESEKIINSLLEQGDIFEVQPGKVKILE